MSTNNQLIMKWEENANITLLPLDLNTKDEPPITTTTTTDSSLDIDIRLHDSTPPPTLLPQTDGVTPTPIKTPVKIMRPHIIGLPTEEEESELGSGDTTTEVLDTRLGPNALKSLAGWWNYIIRDIKGYKVFF